MSDQGENSCPLCAEEMDLTDQQLKPCKCGYEICVWCWHHIMEMAEKDETQGRCPACRTPYNKEKIVGMTSKCERILSEVNVERKLKSQKGKNKTSEGRKQLGSVRVIQKNLVYVVGLPFHLADEDILQRKEYFGQYGKVLRVSMSRTTTGAIQNFPNNTCSVYITYSKEEEAIRCIQLVDGFFLDGRPLRACFGTTKYCHAWLRNAPCNNPDCLYLHEIGSQEDSFTKHEIISSYTRNRVPQFTGASNNNQRHSGSVLPSPIEENSSDYYAAFQGKPVGRPTANTNNFTNARYSPPNSSSGRHAALPIVASWGSRPSSYQTSLTSARVSGPPNQKTNVSDSSTSAAKVAVSVDQAHSLTRKKEVHDEKTSNSQDMDAPESSDPTKAESLSEPDGKNFIDENGWKEDGICSAISSMDIHVNRSSRNGYAEHVRSPVIGQMSDNVMSTTEVHRSSKSDFRFGLQNEPPQAELQRKEGDLLSLTIPTARDRDFSKADGSTFLNLNNQAMDRRNDLMDSASIFANSHEIDDAVYSKLSRFKQTQTLFRGYEGGGAASCASGITEECNMLSLDHDSWNGSFASPNNLFGEENQMDASGGVINSRKIHRASQSRFAFAREDAPDSQVYSSDFGQSSSNLYEDVFKQMIHPLVKNLSNFPVDKFVNRNNLPVMESEIFSSKHLPASRSQISAPPGFSAPTTRLLPPPGFSSFGTQHLNEYRNVSHINGDIEFIDPAILAVGKGTFARGIFGFEDPPRAVSSSSPYDNNYHRFTTENVSIRGGNSYGTTNIYPFSGFGLPQSSSTSMDVSELLRRSSDSNKS